MDKGQVKKYFEDEVFGVPRIILEFPLQNLDPLGHLPIYLEFCNTFLDIVEPKDVLICPIYLQEYVLENGEVVEDFATDYTLGCREINYADFINIDADGLKKFFEYEGELGIKSIGAYKLDTYLKIRGEVVVLSNYHERGYEYEVVSKLFKDGISFFNMLENRYIIHSFEIESFSGDDSQFITAQISFESDVLWVNKDLADILKSKLDYLADKGWIIKRSPLE